MTPSEALIGITFILLAGVASGLLAVIGIIAEIVRKVRGLVSSRKETLSR